MPPFRLLATFLLLLIVNPVAGVVPAFPSRDPTRYRLGIDYAGTATDYDSAYASFRELP